MHMPASIGQSLFVGPDALGVTVSRGSMNRDSLVLRHHLSKDTRLVTSGVLSSMFPDKASGDIPSDGAVRAFFEENVFPELPNLTPGTAGMALQLLDAVKDQVADRSQAGKMQNLEFNRLYFALRGDCRAMIDATLENGGRSAKFHVWPEPGTVVVGNDALIGRVAEISENGEIEASDRKLASQALRSLKGLRGGDNSRSWAFSHQALPDIMRIVSDFQVERLLRKHGNLIRRAVR